MTDVTPAASAATPEVVAAPPVSVAAPAPVAASAPPSETAPVASPDSPPPVEASTTAEAVPAEAPKPVEAENTVEPAATETPPAEEAKTDAAPVAPVYPDFKVPEGFTVEAPTMTAYKNVLQKYGMTPEAGQELVDFHSNELKNYATKLEQQQRDAFDTTRREWVGRVDKEFGNRRDTVVNDANWAMREFGGDKKQQKELFDALAYTGAGDHPAFIRWASNVAKKMRERSAPQQGNPNTVPSDPVERRYGKRA